MATTKQPRHVIRTRPKSFCFLCGAAGKVIYEDLNDSVFDAPGVWRMKRCAGESCDLLWLDPCPIPEDIPLAYTSYYTHESVSAGTGARVRNLLYGCYRIAQSLSGLLTGLHRERIRAAYMFLNELNPGRLLDVGCGDGGFLHRMRKLGWSVDGCDFDLRALNHAKLKYGLDLRHGDIKSIALTAGSLDAITLHHVIEHVPDPLAVFAECQRLLRPGGILVVTTPNSLSDGHARFKSCWRGLEPPRHLHIFSPQALAVCARRNHLDVVSAKSTAANADVISGASFSISEAEDHKSKVYPRPSVARTIKAWLFQLQEHQRVRSGVDCGEEAVLVCEKPKS